MKQSADDPDAAGALTPGAFQKLLELLDSDPQRVGERYEKIRQKLVRFFEWRGVPVAEELADLTIDRVTRKLEAGETIRSSDPAIYFYGVARNILREHWKQAAAEKAAVRTLSGSESETDPARSERSEAALEERRLACLERCLLRLSPGAKDLILRYYQEARRIEGRQALARDLGIPLNALRIRAFRVRGKLESCIEQCLGARATETEGRFRHNSVEKTARP